MKFKSLQERKENLNKFSKKWLSESHQKYDITNIKATGGSGNSPLKFKFNYNGQKYEYEFRVLQGHSQGSGFMGTQTRPETYVQVRGHNGTYGEVPIYEMKSAYTEQTRYHIAEWLVRQDIENID